MNNNNPHAFAQLTPDHILSAIESLGFSCDGRILALNSYENRVYQVGVSDDDPVVAKFYRPNRWSDEAIEEEHQFTLTLAREELPVIAPIRNNEGKTLFKHGIFRFALYLRRGGREIELDNPDHLQQIGRFIARIHSIGEARTFKFRQLLNIEDMAIEPSQHLLEMHFIPDYLVDAYSSVTFELIKLIKNVFNYTNNIQYIRLHGDCHPGNILWTDEGPHIVDFDDARMGPAVQDLWMFLSGDRDYMSSRLSYLLKGYTEFRHFNANELALIEALRSLRIIHYAGWIAKRWGDPAFPAAFPWFNTTRYWEEHILSLKEQLSLLNEPPIEWIY